MEASDSLRHKIIDDLMAPHTEKVADAAVKFWELMAAQIVSIVGEDGFTSLYIRSLFLAQSTFPWLAPCTLMPQPGNRFEMLKNSLEEQTPMLASKANYLLLITFTDILASLIGEELTISILRLAWDNNI